MMFSKCYISFYYIAVSVIVQNNLTTIERLNSSKVVVWLWIVSSLMLRLLSGLCRDQYTNVGLSVFLTEKVLSPGELFPLVFLNRICHVIDYFYFLLVKERERSV